MGAAIGSHGLAMGLPMGFPMEGGGAHEASYWKYDEPHGQFDGTHHGKSYVYDDAYHA